MDLTEKEIKAILDIVDGTIDTLLDFEETDGEIEEWLVIAEKLDSNRGQQMRKLIEEAN